MLNYHPCTTVHGNAAIFVLVLAFDHILLPKKFMMIFITVQDLLCWQRDGCHSAGLLNGTTAQWCVGMFSTNRTDARQMDGQTDRV